VAAHVLGYLSEVNDSDIAKSDGYYNMGDFAGKTGIEKSYEEQLKGIKGVRHTLVDALNREQGIYQNGKFDVPAKAGNDLITGIDIKLQEYGEKLMQGRRGSIIAIEPSTGEILAFVSVPTYDPNLLIGRNRNKNYRMLYNDPNKPFLNRAINARYPPGSTIKPIMALIALDEKVINPSTTYVCNGGYKLTSTKTIKCHSSGTFDLHGSIMMSCNTYYCHLFKELIDQRKYPMAYQGIDHWHERLTSFGMGSKLHIDIPAEVGGRIPDGQYYNKRQKTDRWKSSSVISLSIGQGEMTLTPLQIVNNACVIANKGYYINPHIVRGIDINGKIGYKRYEKHDVKIDTSYFNKITEAMQDVVDRGTAIYGKVPGIEVCGKTGTAQNPAGEDHSIYMAFAPKKKPKIALVVIIENGGFGGTWAAPLGGLMIAKYLKDSMDDFSKRNEAWIVSEGQKLALKQQSMTYENAVKREVVLKDSTHKAHDSESKNKNKHKVEGFPVDTSKIKESTGEDE
jgi:penicillin-binding protein 2